ncbi:MAG: electron transfer flavoprotein subunit beta/FixA family protein [Legionella sp.]|nr:electron transfer flavoprotein subunit beta/FixA family protein [Legionella sp.]
MKILVATKRVVGPYVKIRIKADKTDVDTLNAKQVINPFDEIAVEQALRLREGGQAKEIVAISIGPDAAQETLRHALALGVDRAILVKSDTKLESIHIAKILKKIIEDEQPDLILMGKQSIDADNNQTPQMLAGLLNWPQATNASKITVDKNQIEVIREIDGGLETLLLQLPAVVSTDLRLNEPRYASLPNIMKAKAKPLAIIELAALGLSLKPHIEVLEVNAPKVRAGGIMVDSVEALLDKLQHEAKVLE